MKRTFLLPRIKSLRIVAVLYSFFVGSNAIFANDLNWVDLLENDSLEHWRGYRMATVPDGWDLKDGVLSRIFEEGQAHAEFVEGGGDLMTRKQYADFELEFEFNIETGGNSGVMYRAVETESRPYWSGPEFQILDYRGKWEMRPVVHHTGANYALHAPVEDFSYGPNKWNHARIVVRQQQVEHWVNGHLAIRYELQSEDWNKRVKDSKFREKPAYGVQPQGHIVFQDHGAEIAFRNIRIRDLGAHLNHGGGDRWFRLFNGNDLDGWNRWLGIPHSSVTGLDLEKNKRGEYIEPLGLNHDPKHVYSVVNVDGQPAIRISGEIGGSLSTLQEYDNYHLRFQYKWGNLKWEPRLQSIRNSGLIYHSYGPLGDLFPNRLFMRGLESQIQLNDTGDLFLLGGPEVDVRCSKLDRPELPYEVHQYDQQAEQKRLSGKGNAWWVVQSGNFENPVDEWNTIELISYNGSSIHIVNGHEVLRVEHAEKIKDGEPVPLNRGKIQFQSEGAEVFYRNIEMKLLFEKPDQVK